MKLINRVLETLFVATGVVLFWRGTWGLMDLYLRPEDPLVSYILSLVIGLLILVLSRRFFDQLI